jgi:hypothetical protein
MTSDRPRVATCGHVWPRMASCCGRGGCGPVTDQIAWLGLPGLLLAAAAAFLITRLT